MKSISILIFAFIAVRGSSIAWAGPGETGDRGEIEKSAPRERGAIGEYLDRSIAEMSQNADGIAEGAARSATERDLTTAISLIDGMQAELSSMGQTFKTEIPQDASQNLSQKLSEHRGFLAAMRDIAKESGPAKARAAMTRILAEKGWTAKTDDGQATPQVIDTGLDAAAILDFADPVVMPPAERARRLALLSESSGLQVSHVEDHAELLPPSVLSRAMSIDYTGSTIRSVAERLGFYAVAEDNLLDQKARQLSSFGVLQAFLGITAASWVPVSRSPLLLLGTGLALFLFSVPMILAARKKKSIGWLVAGAPFYGLGLGFAGAGSALIVPFGIPPFIAVPLTVAALLGSFYFAIRISSRNSSASITSEMSDAAVFGDRFTGAEYAPGDEFQLNPTSTAMPAEGGVIVEGRLSSDVLSALETAIVRVGPLPPDVQVTVVSHLIEDNPQIRISSGGRLVYFEYLVHSESNLATLQRNLVDPRTWRVPREASGDLSKRFDAALRIAQEDPKHIAALGTGSMTW